MDPDFLMLCPQHHRGIYLQLSCNIHPLFGLLRLLCSIVSYLARVRGFGTDNDARGRFAEDVPEG